MRKRIVINLDGPQGAPALSGKGPGRKRRRWSRILGVFTGLILIVFVALAVVGFLWWRHYRSTPTYALTVMIDAAQRNDVTEFQKRIDDDEVAKNMAASVSQKAAGRYGFALNSSIQQEIDNLMPSVLPRFKQTIHDEIVRELKEFASKSEPRPFVFLVAKVPSLVKVTTEGDTAKATATMSERTIELTMRRVADYWKVVDFKDDVVVQRVVDGVMKELPAIGSIDSRNPLQKKSARGKRARRNR